jgi:hypothetical protein
MLTRPLHHLRRNVIAYLALFLAIGGGGGYAFAATQNKTIHGCVNNGSHVLYIKKRCGRGESRLVWSQQAPQGQVTAWAAVNEVGFTGDGTRGITVNHVSTGVYNVTATLSQCANVTSAPQITVDTAISSATPGQFPEAWEVHSGSGNNTFTVFTGVVANGTFTAADEPFNVAVPCS